MVLLRQEVAGLGQQLEAVRRQRQSLELMRPNFAVMRASEATTPRVKQPQQSPLSLRATRV